MGNPVTALQGFDLSAEELRELTNWPQTLVEDYLTIGNNLAILSTRFQMFKNGAQATTGAFAPLVGWTEERNQRGFSLDTVTGQITLPAAGEYIFDVWALGDGDTELNIKIQVDDQSGGGFVDIPTAVNRQDKGVNIAGFIFTASLGFVIRIVIQHVGSTVNIDTDFARVGIRRVA